MTTATATQQTPLSNEVKRKVKSVPRPLTLEEFRRKYADREDGYKYEFKKGEVIKTPNAMNIKQFHIVKNITRRFSQTRAYAKGDELGSEVEQITLPERMRRPDLCYIPSEKLKKLDESISEFVIEIISPSDKLEDVEDKLHEYFEAGVKVVWQIRPRTQSIHVYTSPTTVTICTGDRVCSAAPVLPDFEMKAGEVFGKVAE